MQTVKRYAYALASYDEQSQSHNTYAEKKASLEECCNNIRKQLLQKNMENFFVSANAVYSAEKNISICCYKNTLFIGFQDKETKQISLDDTSNSFVTMPSISPEKLQERMTNAIADAEKNRQNLMSQQMQKVWEPLFPVLDRILEFENEFKKLPRYVQESLDRRGEHETAIDRIINNSSASIMLQKEEKQVIPEVKTPYKENSEKNVCDMEFSKRCALAKQTAEKIKKETFQSRNMAQHPKEKAESNVMERN